ncbi:probable E3 ubiquitin-protein ligase TRIML1 [Notamacropus eugenii]|uniref:probable E3 ubiquitin-protein ligase TRIML1 n=1 Tax=Notamacropus eugenii TaxID=9315 RepID=UPI003B684AD7
MLSLTVENLGHRNEQNQNPVEKVKTEIKTISSEFKKAQQFLDEEKNEYLFVQRQGGANLKGLQKRIRTLALQSQELRRISESMEVCRKPDVDLLQSTHLTPSLRKQSKSLPIPFIKPKLLSTVSITLDPDTADPGLIISEDLKGMRYGGAQPEMPLSTRRFTDFAQVLGNQCLISSRYYWAVEVPYNTGWCVGISNGSPGPEVFFVLMAIQSHSGCLFFAIGKHHISSVPHVKYCQHCVSNLMVGIFLDYEHGKVSFYSIKERFLIFSFPISSFSGLFQSFFCLSKEILTNNCTLKICP